MHRLSLDDLVLEQSNQSCMIGWARDLQFLTAAALEQHPEHLALLAFHAQNCMHPFFSSYLNGCKWVPTAGCGQMYNHVLAVPIFFLACQARIVTMDILRWNLVGRGILV